MKRKINLKTWQLALVLLLSALLPIVLVVSMTRKTNAQMRTADIRQEEPGVCKGRHNRKDFYKNIRMLEPASILKIDGNRVNYVIASEGIELGSFDLEAGHSIVPKGFDANHHDGCYGLVYCEKHLIILAIDVLEQKNCGTVKQ